MKKYLLFLLTVIPLIASAQSKIVLKNGLKRVVLTEGQDVGITRSGEPFYYDNWKHVCQGCSDTFCSKEIWTLHDVRKNDLVLTRFPLHDSAYIIDTLRAEEFYTLPDIKLWLYVNDMGDIDSGNYRMIGKKALFLDTITVDYKSLVSLSFAKTQKCKGFTAVIPLGAAFLILAAPFVANEEGGFNWATFAAMEGGGLLLGATVISYVRRHKIKTFNLSEWSLRVR